MFNSQLVDGCLTDDGDVFLYGAKTVYRNFTMNTQVSVLYMYFHYSFCFEIYANINQCLIRLDFTEVGKLVVNY